MKLIIFTLYLIQSVIYGFFYSIPLTYKEIPNYHVLTIFGAASIPFSFKFIIAPFAQRYYLRSYGKRKTWIVFNLVAMAIFTVLMGEVVGQPEYQMWAAVLLMLSIFFSAMKDVGTDALTVQTIENAATASNIQLSAEQVGETIGLSVFLALISKGYWSDYGIEHEIVTAKTFIRIVAAAIIITAIIVHLTVHESTVRNGPQKDQTLWQAVGHYRHLVMPRYQLCRLGIFFLVISHGLLYFQRTYEYEYIRKQLIDRETLMFLGDFCFIPNIIVCYLFGKLIRKENLFKYYWYVYICSFAIYLGVYLIQAQQRGVIMLLTVLIRISKGLQYYMKYCLLNQMCRGSNSAVNFTGLLSLMNLGWNYSIQTELIYMLGYDSAMAIGFSIAAIFMIGLPAFGRWIQRGEKAVPVKEE